MVLLFGARSLYNRLRYPEHPHGSIQSRSKIEAQATQIGLALANSVRIIAPAEMHIQRETIVGKPDRIVKAWVVLCEAGDSQLNLLFDDKTGCLSCLVMDGPTSTGKSAQDLPIHSAKEAMSVGIERLRSLKMLPRGSQIALREKPQPSESKSTWVVNWLVRMPSQAEPHTIKMTLDQASGKPVCLVDVVPNF